MRIFPMFLSALGGFDGSEEVAIDLDGDRALQDFDIHDDAPVVVFANQRARYALEASMFDSDALSDSQIGPGPGAGAGIEDGADGVDFGIVHGDGLFTETDDR